MQEPQENPKFSVKEFATQLKSQRPEYADIDDLELVKMVVDKYPQYSNQVSFEEPSKKKGSTESPYTSETSPTATAGKSRKDLIEQFRGESGVDATASDDYIARAMARVHPELRSTLVPPPPSFEPETYFDGTTVSSEPRDAVKIIDDDPNELQRLWNRSIASSEMGRILTRAQYGVPVDFEELAYYQKVMEDNAVSSEDWLAADEENVIGSFLLDVVRTLPESFISLIDSSLSPEAGGAALAGAGAGSAVPIIGTAAGAAAGAAFYGSGALTFGTTLIGKMQEAGVDVTDADALERAYNNRDFIQPLIKESAIKAGIVGSFDALSAGIGGGISKSVMKAGASRARAEVAEYLGEGVLGGAGEAFGSLAAGDEISVRDVLLEMTADPAAGVVGRTAKSARLKALGRTPTETEQKLQDLSIVEEDKFGNAMNVSKVENAEELAVRNQEIAELESAKKKAETRDQKKIIQGRINELKEEKNVIHAETIEELVGFENDVLEEMSAEADKMVELAKTAQKPDVTASEKQQLEKMVQAKRDNIRTKRGKKKKRSGKKINVSSTSRGTGAPVEVAPEPFIEPDAAQGFEEFENSQEVPITEEDVTFEELAKEQFVSELPEEERANVNPEELPVVVQRRVDAKGRNIETFSETRVEDGVQKTEYYSEREGEKIPSGGVVFTKEDGFDKLLKKFPVPEAELNEALGEGVEAVAMTASETDGTNGKLQLMVKKEDGVFNIEVPFTESTEAAVEDTSLSEEGKETAQLLAGALRETVEAFEGVDPEELTEAEIRALEEAANIQPPTQAVPASAYEDAFDADFSDLDPFDEQFLADINSGQAKEVNLGLDYVRKVSKALKNPNTNLVFDEKEGWKVVPVKKKQKVDVDSTKAKSIEETKGNINRALAKGFQEALSDPKDLTVFLAENAMQGDEFTVITKETNPKTGKSYKKKSIYKVESVVEGKEKPTAELDLKTFGVLEKTGKTNVKDALDVLYRKSLDKNQKLTRSESATLDAFERGRFKEIKNKKVSIADIKSLLNVLNVTKKDGSAAMKQAFAMAKDNKTVSEFYSLKKKLLTGENNYILKDANGNPIKTEKGNLRVDEKKLYADDLQTALKYRNLKRRTNDIFLMRDFVDRIKEGKFAELNDKKNPVPLTKYMADRGVVTSAGSGLTRTVKFKRYTRKTGEPMATTKTGKPREVLSKIKSELRDYPEEQYTATVKDGVVRRKAINSDNITRGYEQGELATYVRFKKETPSISKTEKVSGSKYRRSVEKRAKVTKEFKDGQKLEAIALRPKSETTLIGALGKVFNLSKDRAEVAGKLSHRLIKNMARRAGISVSDMYDKITLVKNENKAKKYVEDIQSERAIGTILRRFGAPISESNLDENGNPIDLRKLDQKAKPVTTEFKKYKQKGVEDSFTAQMIEDLKNLGVNLMSQKGDINELVEGMLELDIPSDQVRSTLIQDSVYTKRAYPSQMRKTLGGNATKNKLLNKYVGVEMPYIQQLVRNNIAAYLRIPVENLDQSMLDLYGMRTGQKDPMLEETKSYVAAVRMQQNKRAKQWLDWLDGIGDEFSMGDIEISDYAKAFNLVKTVLSFNYSSFNNPENKLVKRTVRSVDNLTPFSLQAANELLSSDGNNPIVDYSNILASKTNETAKKRTVKKNSDGTYWVKYNKLEGLSYEESQAEVDALTFAAIQTSWCTASAAEQHLKGGNFHILFDKNNNPLTAIRMENGKIAEERGNTPNQALIEEYDKHLLEYKEGGFVEGYSSADDFGRLSLQISEARKAEWNLENTDLYLKDIADSVAPKATLEFYAKKYNDFHENNPVDQSLPSREFNKEVAKRVKGAEFFNDIAILEDGLNEFGEDIFNKIVIVPKSTWATISSETTGVMKVKELIISDSSVEFKGFDDISIDKIKESAGSLENSAKGYYPQVVVRDNRFKDSSEYGDITRVRINEGVASIAFEQGIGAVEVIEGTDAWITEVSFADNVVRDGKRFRSLADIPDARDRFKLIVYGPEVFDKEGYFAGKAYDETWSEGARILNQEIESQTEKERFVKEHLSIGDDNVGYERVNEFDKKKDALDLIKRTKDDFPSLKFKVFKKSGLVTNRKETAGKYFIHVERNPKYKAEKKTQKEARAAIALVDGEAVIFALTNPNVSSPLHELSHMYEEYLTENEVKLLEKWSGSKYGTEAFSEYFARGFERYLAEGNAPTPELNGIFSRLKKWMRDIYNTIKGSPIEKDLTPEVVTIFDNMVMVEGDVNFSDADFDGNFAKKTNSKVKKVLNQRDMIADEARNYEDKFDLANSNAQKEIAAVNELKKTPSWQKWKKSASDRQTNIRKYMEERSLKVAEARMNQRAGASARAAKKVEPIAEKIYDGMSKAQEDAFNKLLMAERIIQIEINREEKRNYYSAMIEKLTLKKEAFISGFDGFKKDGKYESAIAKIDAAIELAQREYNKNRLYVLDDNTGVETDELMFKHPLGLTREDAESLVSKYMKRPDYAVLNERKNIYFKAMSENLKDLYDNGIINKQTYDRFKNQNYIPRVFLEHVFNLKFDSEGQAIGVSFAENSEYYKSVGLGEAQIKSLEQGSEGLLLTNSRYLLETTYRATSARVMKNRAAQALAKEMKGQQTTWFSEAEYVTDKNGDIKLDRYGNAIPIAPEKTMSQVKYRIDGKLRAFNLDNEAFREWNDIELKMSDDKGLGWIRKGLGVGLLKRLATGMNPLFFIANVPMDIGHVLFFTDVYDNNKLLPVSFARISSKFFKNTRGLIDIDRGVDNKNSSRTKKLMDIYFEYGGGMDFLTQQGQGLMESGSDAQKAKSLTNKSLRAKSEKVLGYTGNLTELAMRLGTVEQVIGKLEADKKAGKNKYTQDEIYALAVGKARATMDFSQGGKTAKQIDMYVPYFNAAMQGFRVSRKYLSTAKGRANFANKWAQASIGVAMITFYNLAFGDDDEDTGYDDVPDYIKDNYFVFMTGEKDEDGRMKYIRIRKAPQIAPFLNLSEGIARAMYYSMKGIEDPNKARSTKGQFLRAVKSIEGTLPVVPTPQGIASKMPPTVAGILKYISNYDPFREMNIVPKNEIGVISASKEGLDDERVPVFLKVMGEAFDISPKRTQAALESVITSPSTNFIVGGAYSLLDEMTNALMDIPESEKSRYTGDFVIGSMLKSGKRRIQLETNPNWRNSTYSTAQQLRAEEEDVTYEIKKETRFYGNEYRTAKTADEKRKILQEFKEFGRTIENPADQHKAAKMFQEFATRDYSKLKNVSQALDVKYTRDPEAAAKMFGVYFFIPDLRKQSDVQKVNETFLYLRKNFDFKPSARFRAELKRLSKEKYKY